MDLEHLIVIDHELRGSNLPKEIQNIIIHFCFDPDHSIQDHIDIERNIIQTLSSEFRRNFGIQDFLELEVFECLYWGFSYCDFIDYHFDHIAGIDFELDISFQYYFWEIIDYIEPGC